MSADKSMPSLLPLHYAGTRIRAYVDAMGMIWWVAQDAAAYLGLKNFHSTLQRFPANEKRAVHTMDSAGRPNTMTMLNEPGIYRLIFQSRRPEAEAFKTWIFTDVLPTLRRTGTYTMQGVCSTYTPVPTLTPQGHLPPPAPQVREHAEVSWHLAAVWTLLRDSGEWLTNREIAQRTGVAPRTARAHSRYLVQLGLVDMREVFPRHLYQGAETARQRNGGVYQRLNLIAETIASRQKF